MGRRALRFAPIAVSCALAALVYGLTPRATARSAHPVPPAHAATVEKRMVSDTTPPPWSAADEAEMRRLNKLGYFAGDTIEVFLIGTVHGALDTLPQLIKDLQRDAVKAGAGTRAIYPGLPSDSVYVVDGPARPDGYDVDPLATNHAARVRFASTPRPVRLVLRDGNPPRNGEPSRVAQAEYRRLWWEGKLDWTEYPMQVAGVFPESELRAAGERLRWVRAAALSSGIADHTVYPELEPGTVAVLVGPYRPERMAWAARRIPGVEQMTGTSFLPRTLTLRDVGELGGWTPEEPGVPPVPPMRRYDWMDGP